MEFFKEPDKSGAFAETVRKLWDVHKSDLGRLESENQKLRVKIRSLEGVQEAPRGPDRIETLKTQSIHSDEAPAERQTTLQHQPKSAWARVVPRQQSDNDLFVQQAETEHDPGKSRSIWKLAEKLVSHPMFDLATSACIFINAVVMAMESQWEGLSVGASLQYASLNSNHQAAWISVEPTFVILGYVFGVLFTLELLVKIVGQKWQFFGQLWNWIDGAIILTWLISVASGSFPVDPTLLRVARLARLLRLLKVLHTFRSLDALYIITTALRGSFSILAWACVLFFIVQMALALLVTNVLTNSYLADESVALTDRQAVYVYFGTFTRSIYSMFEITLANWPPVSRLLAENVSEWFMLFGVLHKLAIGFAVVSVVNGVFMQETFSVASSDDRVMIQKRNRLLQTHKKKMKRFFNLADKSKNGSIDMEEFKKMTEHKEVSAWLASMELDVSDPKKLFNLIDSVKRDGTVSLEELIYGVGRLKGPARSLDVACLMEELKDLKTLLLGQGVCLSSKDDQEESVQMSFPPVKEELGPGDTLWG